LLATVTIQPVSPAECLLPHSAGRPLPWSRTLIVTFRPFPVAATI